MLSLKPESSLTVAVGGAFLFLFLLILKNVQLKQKYMLIVKNQITEFNYKVRVFFTLLL